MSSRIGVTATNAVKAQPYIDALEMVGATPVWLQNDAANAGADLSRLDGILVSGGPDIAPHHFGEELHPKTEATVPERDAYELDLIKAAWNNDVPMLAICRGLQVMNVALGGTLIQHVPDVADGEVDHHSGHDISERHIVEIEPDSKLGAIVARQIFPTNSTHHQALAKVAEPLRVTARTSDGIVEAVESLAARRFWIGVQWHPERTLPKGDAPSVAILSAFVKAAAR
jgi:putative glutamine amidotransferase